MLKFEYYWKRKSKQILKEKFYFLFKNLVKTISTQHPYMQGYIIDGCDFDKGVIIGRDAKNKLVLYKKYMFPDLQEIIKNNRVDFIKSAI